MKQLIISLGILMAGIFTQSCVNPICLDPVTPPVAEESWEELTSAVTGNFMSLNFVNKNTGYIGGVGGVLAKTTDGGQNFTPVSTGTGNSIYAIHFSDASTGIIAGDGLLKRTTDGGDTWTDIPFSNPGFRNSFFLTRMHGWICGGGGTIMETTDGGATWNTLNTGTTTHTIYCVQFVNENVGYAAGHNQLVLKTTDGGVTWNPLTIPGGEIINRDFLCMHFVNENVGYISGLLMAPNDDGYIMKTTDGGVTWTTLDHPRASTSFYGIVSTDENNVYFSGGTISSSNPLLVKTTDGGSTWTVVNDTVAGRLGKIQVINGTLYTVGHNTSIIKGSNL